MAAMPSAAEPPVPPSRPLPLDDAREILARIRQLRLRHGRVALTTGLAMAVTAISIWLVSETVTDFLSNLAWAVRLVFLIGGVSGAVALLFWFGIRTWRRRLPDETVALMIERALPIFRSRFIASVQLARAGDAAASPVLVKALAVETTALAATQDFSAVVDTRLLRRWLKIAIFALLLAAGLAFAGGSKALPLLRRALLFRIPVPRKTVLIEIAAPRVIAIGDTWRVSVVAGGIVPQGGHVYLKFASGRRQTVELPPDSASPPTFALALQSMQESFEYRIGLGDAESDPAFVKVKPRPGVASVECRQSFPAYSRLPAQRRALGDLKILAGSRLALKVRTNARIKSGEIRLVGADHDKIMKTALLTLDPRDPAQLTGEIAVLGKDDLPRRPAAKAAAGADRVLPAAEATPAAETVDAGLPAGMTLHFVDEDGIESRGAAIYPLEILRDEAPTVKILWPEHREELLTREATMLLSFVAKDDYGVARVRLNYAVDWVEGGPYKSIDLDLGSNLPKELNRRFDWRIPQITPRVEEGSVIDYWFEVLDANDITGPGVGATEHMQVRIVSEAEKRADLANRLGDTMQGLSGVKRSQEEVNQQLGEMIFEKPASK